MYKYIFSTGFFLLGLGVFIHSINQGFANQNATQQHTSERDFENVMGTVNIKHFTKIFTNQSESDFILTMLLVYCPHNRLNIKIKHNNKNNGLAGFDDIFNPKATYRSPFVSGNVHLKLKPEDFLVLEIENEYEYLTECSYYIEGHYK